MSKVNFKYKIGQTIKDDKRDMVIIDREIRNCQHWYKYRCNIDNNEDWIRVYELENHINCNVCSNRKVMLGINTIWDTDKYLVTDYGLEEEFAKTHTIGTGEKGKFTCKCCGRKKYLEIRTVKKRNSIGCICGDGVSYPEKFMYSVLSQLNIKFETQYSPEWLNSKQKYDFYLSDYNTIIETHGEQHYKDSNRGRTLQEEQENDRIKEELALNNGIKNYIVIDCRKSEINWIKEQILNSDLVKLFDLSTVNWDKCNEFALKNLVKEVCDYWHEHREINGEDITTKDVSKIFGLNKSTIRNYFKKGKQLGWCNYNPKEESKLIKYKTGGNNKKSVYCIELNKTFQSLTEASNYCKVSKTCICEYLKGKQKSAGKLPDGTKLHWQYVEQAPELLLTA